MDASRKDIPLAGKQVQEGLENVVVTATRLSEVDGAKGALTIAGLDVEHAAREATYEEMCARLWSAALGTPLDARTVGKALGEERVRAYERLERAPAHRADGMDDLRGALSAIDLEGLDPLGTAARLTAATAVHAAAWLAWRRNVRLSQPDPDKDHGADCTDLLLARRADRGLSGSAGAAGAGLSGPGSGAAGAAARQGGLRAYLVTVSDHGLNASTFTARVIASTGSDPVSACVGAVGALKGPLHGGAPGPVLDMLDAIGSADRAQAWFEAELKAGHRIMGMGHRVYRVRDPRAAALEAAIERLERAGISTPRLTLARQVERSALKVLRAKYPDRALEANVEFYTAVLLDSIGIAREAFSPAFAMGRIGGWVAHYFEQRRTGKLIRPESIYIGPKAA